MGENDILSVATKFIIICKTRYGIETDHFEMTLGQIFIEKIGSKNILDLSHRENRQKNIKKWSKMAFLRP